MNFFFLRHTSLNIEKDIFYGQTDIDVSKNFDKELKNIKTKLNKEIRNLNKTKIFSSTLKRCVKLAKGLSQDVFFDENLKELNLGDWEMKPKNKISRKLVKEWEDNLMTFKIPNGESNQDFLKRLKIFLDEIKKQDQDVLIVSHAGSINGMMSILTGHPFDKLLKKYWEKIDYGSLSLVESIGKSFNIKAGIVIDATGSGSDLIHSNNKTHDNRVKSKWWKATNLIFNRRIDTPYAVGLPSTQEGYGNDSESRYFFFVPYKDTTLFGTFYSLIEDSPDDLSVKKEDVENMLSVAQKLCPDAGLKIRDVSMCHVGVVPASASSSNGNSSIAKNSVVRVMPSSSSLDGLITVQSVKYTESFQVAQEVINLVSRNLGLKCKNSKSEFAIKIEDRSCLSIKEIIQKAVEEEMAIHLTDLIIRRTTIGETEYPGDDLAENYASVMGDIAGWSSDRRQNEIIQLKEYYRVRAAHQLV